MNPVFLPVFIVAIVFGFVLMVVKMHYDDRARGRASAGDNSLTTSELQRMIERAVAEATAGLEARLAELEARSREVAPARRLGAAEERLQAGEGTAPAAADDLEGDLSSAVSRRRTAR